MQQAAFLQQTALCGEPHSYLKKDKFISKKQIPILTPATALEFDV
jgi:hypothetical protein